MCGALHQRPLTEERQHQGMISKATDRADELLETVIVVHLLFLAEVLDDAWLGATAGAHALDQAERAWWDRNTPHLESLFRSFG